MRECYFSFGLFSRLFFASLLGILAKCVVLLVLTNLFSRLFFAYSRAISFLNL